MIYTNIYQVGEQLTLGLPYDTQEGAMLASERNRSSKFVGTICISEYRYKLISYMEFDAQQRILKFYIQFP